MLNREFRSILQAEAQMVQLADKHTPSPSNRVGAAPNDLNRVGSHFDDLLTSPQELSKQRLATELATELWSRLPISRVAEESGDRGIEHTIRIVTASTSQVQEWYRELSDFAPAIARAAMEFRGVELMEKLQAGLAEDMESQMLEHFHYPLPNRSFVDFKFADLPPAEAWTQAHLRIERDCVEFANHVFAFFDSLQQKKLIGQIQETSSTCRFTYFRRIAIVGPAVTSVRQREQHDSDQKLDAHGVIFETVHLTDFEIQHRHAQHVHHVRNPTLNQPKSTIHPLPPKYSDLIDACPEWLSGSIRVLEGELFRDERIEWDLFTETRTAEKVIERVRRDPAVVFGPYILAGWGELSIVEEESRQRDEQDVAAKKVSAKKARQKHWLSIAVAGLAMTAILVTGSATAVTTSIAIILGLIAMILAGSAAHSNAVARGNLSGTPVLLHSTLIGATVFAVQGLAYSLLHWSLPALGLAAFSAVISVIAYVSNGAGKELGGSSVD